MYYDMIRFQFILTEHEKSLSRFQLKLKHILINVTKISKAFCIISSLTSRMVCLLLYQMVRSSFSCRRTSWNRRIVAIASLVAIDRARSSASVEEVVTVICLPDFHAIGPPNRINRYPYINFLSCWLLANEELI